MRACRPNLLPAGAGAVFSLPEGMEPNPQNTPEPSVKPSPDLDAEGAVRTQLESLKDPHEPFTNHGIMVMYEFCEGAGAMERSRYFGYSKDLYHFDHFLGMFQNGEVGKLCGLASYDIKTVAAAGAEGLPAPPPGSEAVVEVEARADDDAPLGRYHFVMVRRGYGKYKDCLMAGALLPVKDGPRS
ncbi:unnamed protein product [Pedinophyceae sp. YPF-701]|nr:unnamed protein product [Pedinophyceae sp. YPF-701]